LVLGLFPEGQATKAWRSPPTPFSAKVYLFSPLLCIHEFMACYMVTFSFALHLRSFVMTKWYLLFTFSSQYSVCLSYILYVFYMPHLAHLPWFDHPNITWLFWWNWIVYVKVDIYGEGINFLLIFGKE